MFPGLDVVKVYQEEEGILLKVKTPNGIVSVHLNGLAAFIVGTQLVSLSHSLFESIAQALIDEEKGAKA